ncbi:fatty acid elongase, putative [Entamoeba histolytica HM-1:IMSS-B]|uniref:3-ketoacyl-CoA synthase n=4 Tax=Entamoeba histolytica TaxID=5759 RepID=C4LZ15_ENTH1|nr:fatty acid elongase, putative [Entamoeba histolytica HM-1:IMSS]EAL49265.1 fatty acid elongase, putative [Entamoeba histolytica HM-1:IMSS]EMH73449.1 fatty acid elongase, putative [Entamoeba histolytica HM-1:IMSS-B]ENY62893.1 3-ketoacyl-CoA synthase, putative [Entamoeba histolytica HM-1:IMSS-A]GAT94084.1 fatty acid elongase putative [Entamoeba histolytica]|eukprot:XP_654651.1 fatty acid elongase, putative [Entamoeba histolytica HM-1:IMSS]
MSNEVTSLQDYWYPSTVGEQNPVLSKLKGSVRRPSFSTQIIQHFPKLILLFCVYSWTTFVLSYFTTFSPLFTSDNVYGIVLAVASLVAGLVYFVWSFASYKPVYLLDFAVAELPEEYEVPNEHVQGPLTPVFEESSVEFVERLAKRTGLGNHTYFPKVFHQDKVIRPTMELSREEALLVMTNSCDKLFNQTGIKPEEIDCVICNCSLFCCTPSLAAMLMNHYKMKSTCKNYSLGGMGCSAGLISIDLAKDFLRCNPNSNVLVFSTENITHSLYYGNERSRLLPYTLFRLGGAAIILTNKWNLRSHSKFELTHLVRVNRAFDDESYNVVFQSEDANGEKGISLGKQLVNCVSKALTKNLYILLPQVLTYKEMAKYGIDYIKRLTNKEYAKTAKAYMPDIRETFQAYCIHAGGRGVIDGIQKNFGLSNEDCLPSRSSLYRFGNTSSSSIWYELMYIERCEMLQKGDKVLQLAFGSGLKVNSAVWKKVN